MNNKYQTSKKTLLFIGKEEGKFGEEYYLDLGDNDVRGWSFMGLRPATEADLRSQARETEPMDVLGCTRHDFKMIEHYFDHKKFANDHDIQATREEDGETLHLGFGSGQDIFGYFDKNNINDFESYKNHFEVVGLNERDFIYLNAIVQKRKNKSSLKMTDAEKLAEKNLFTNYFTEHESL